MPRAICISPTHGTAAYAGSHPKEPLVRLRETGAHFSATAVRPPPTGPVTTAYAGSSGNPITYVSHHALSVLPMGNTVTETWGYNQRLQPTSVGASSTAAGNLLTLSYVYGATSTQNNGNVSSATIGLPGLSPISQAFTYDGVNRLTGAVENSSACTQSFTDWCQQFTYDPFGNRTASSFGQGVSPLTPAGFTSSNRNSGSAWVYDASGNITADPGQSAYAYDAENRQIAYCVNASTCSVSTATMSYSYDGDGKRVQTQGSSGTTTFVYDTHGELVAEYGSPAPPCSGTCYVTVDSVGSTRMVTDHNGVCQQQYDYLPFGQNITVTSGSPRSGDSCYSFSSTAVRQQFTSKERDAETGLDFFGARYMSSAQGRFTSADPKQFPHDITDPQSWNKYSYTRNNPLRYVDPDGEDWRDFGSGVADTTYRPIVQAVSHPLNTLAGLGNLIAHPIDSAVAIKNAVLETAADALSGDSTALGQVTGTVISAVVTAGIGKAAESVVQGAEVGEAAGAVSKAAGTTSKVDGIFNTIEQGGFKVTANPKTALQDANITITHPNEPGVNLNLRSETHPLPGSGGQPVPHVNVEKVTPRTGTTPKKIDNTHITQ